MTELARLGACEAARRIAAGELTSQALVTACLERIEARDPVVRAWAHLDADAALEAARARDTEAPRGPLHGVPVAVKDIIDTADLPTEHGSPIHRGRRPDRDAACVEALRRAGAVVLGKTVTTEFATLKSGPTTNPHDSGRTPGGSSSGSAAAVADGMVPLALGSQTSGSIVRPAAFCGIFGLKPTLGLVPMRGVQPLSETLDVVGPLARESEDLLAALPALGGPAVPPTARVDRQLRIAFAHTPQWDAMDADAADRLLDAAAWLREQEVVVDEVTLPEPFARLHDAQMTIFAAEAARALRWELAHHRDQMSDLLGDWLASGRDMPASELAGALHDRSVAGMALAPLWEVYDALLVPAVRGEAPTTLATTGDPVFCRSWTTLGGPAMAVPGLHGANGLPLGLQVTAAPGQEATVVAVGARIASLLQGR